MSSVDEIDALLERYLGLLDSYTRLRGELNKLQQSLYQDLARANFSAERGIRYGRDFYDERMQSLRRVAITPRPADNVPCVTVVSARGGHAGSDEPGKGDGNVENSTTEKNDARTSLKAKDPLLWFGMMAPSALRLAQKQAVEAVEDLIPRLASVTLEMTAVEIEVRRARKKRAKAEAAEFKTQQSDKRATAASIESHGPSQPTATAS